MSYTIAGGVRMEEYKRTRRQQIKRMSPAPRCVCIPMLQHAGTPSTPLVSPGDIVCRGQLIGEASPEDEHGGDCRVHASVSGRVTRILERDGAVCVEIENDFEDRLSPELKPFDKRLSDTSSDEIIEIIKNAGIAGLGGAAVPTHIKLRAAIGKTDTLIINGTECEPFFTSNHRLMLESPASVINGVKILLKTLSLRRATIAVADNKPDAVSKLEGLLVGSALIKVKVCKTKYPQGAQRQLISALTGREIAPDGLPIDARCLVFNVETCAAIFRAFAKGIPLIERVVTVDGDCVREPGNVLVPLGTSALDVLDACGGLKKPPSALILGGPMTGAAQCDLSAPIVKGTRAILAFSRDFEGIGRYEQTPTCIHCGKCAEVCPARLLPNYIADLYNAGMHDEIADEFGADACIECGACSYVCPGYYPVTQYVKMAKHRPIKNQLTENELTNNSALPPTTTAAEE